MTTAELLTEHANLCGGLDEHTVDEWLMTAFVGLVERHLVTIARTAGDDVYAAVEADATPGLCRLRLYYYYGPVHDHGRFYVAGWVGPSYSHEQCEWTARTFGWFDVHARRRCFRALDALVLAVEADALAVRIT